MSNQILIKRGTSSPTPTLEYGELGYNSTEGTLYIGNSNRENVAIGGPGAFVKKSGDTMTGWLTFDGTTIGTKWNTNDGTEFAIRPYSSGNLFQITTNGTETENVTHASFNIKNNGEVWLGKPLGITSGGTGATTPKEAEYNINGSIVESTETIGDAHRLVFSRTTPTTTNGVFIYKQASLLWNYIKGKTDDQYLKLSGGTLTGNLTVNKTDSSGFVALKEDGEGGTIQIGSKNGTYTYEIDAYNDTTIRLHQAPKHPDGITNKFLTWHGDTGQLDATSLTLGSALSVSYGGTGATSARAAEYNICNGIAQVTSAMDDDTQIIIKRTRSASTANGVFCYRNASLLKSYLFVYSSSTPSSSHNVTGKIWLKPV